VKLFLNYFWDYYGFTFNLEYACEIFWGLGPLVWEEIENERTVHKGLAKLLYRYESRVALWQPCAAAMAASDSFFKCYKKELSFWHIFNYKTERNFTGLKVFRGICGTSSACRTSSINFITRFARKLQLMFNFL
jgi:hypothetical protein